MSVESGKLCFSAKDGRCVRYLRLCIQIAAFALPVFIRVNVHAKVQIAGAPVRAHPAFSFQAYALTLINAGRNVDIQCLYAAGSILQAYPFAASPERFAKIDRDIGMHIDICCLAGSLTAAAKQVVKNTASSESAEGTVEATAAGTSGRTCPVEAIAVKSKRRTVEPVSVSGEFREISEATISEAMETLSAGTAAKTAETAAETAVLLSLLPCFFIGLGVTALKSGHTAGIINPFLLRIAQDAVRFADLLKLPGGCCISGIHVRMVFFRKFSVCFLDIRLTGAFGQPEDGIIILLHPAFTSHLSEYMSCPYTRKYRTHGRFPVQSGKPLGSVGQVRREKYL